MSAHYPGAGVGSPDHVPGAARRVRAVRAQLDPVPRLTQGHVSARPTSVALVQLPCDMSHLTLLDAIVTVCVFIKLLS